MKFRKIDFEDVKNYRDDIEKIYKDCNLIFDSQNTIPHRMPIWVYVANFADSQDSYVLGIFSDDEEFLYGLVIFDNIRMANKSCAEVHIVTDKAIWGRCIRDLYVKILKGCIFDTLYCQVPSIAVHVIAICKRLGFKKTGYIPEALPYVNSKGEERMYDLQIYTYRRV
jgi:RimJ/RimL family protein N-acetyltransferase